MADAKKRQNRWLRFGLTINTNQRILRGDPKYEEFAGKFSGSIEGILNNIGEYLKFTYGDYSADNFKNVDVRYCLEPAPKTNCVHAHIYLGFQHKTNLHLDYDKILDKVKADIELPSINMKNKILRTQEDADRWIDYMTKYVNGEADE